jgi:purine-nucleoside phosphorylase
MRILGISSITNLAVPDPAPGTELSHEEVMEAGKLIVPRLAALLRGVVRQL